MDIALVAGKRFVPVEVKWTSQLRGADLKQIKTYDNGVILTKTSEPGTISGIHTEFLPKYLLDLGRNRKKLEILRNPNSSFQKTYVRDK